MRAFIALEISDEQKNALDQVETHLKYAGADVKWVEKSNIHLTLKFLGEISEEKSQEVRNILDDIARHFKPFEVGANGRSPLQKDIGVFPSMEHPRVIWVGLDKGAEESKRLAEEIDEQLSKIGFAKEARPFAAHLTIGRVRSPKNKQALKEKMLSYTLPSIPPTLIQSIILFKSTLTPKGSIYTKIHEAKL